MVSRHVVGSNQYRHRPAARPLTLAAGPASQPPAASEPTLCGQVHGGSCPVPVRGPEWQCPQHDTLIVRILAAIRSSRPEVLEDLSRTDARDFVAENPDCPQTALERLSWDTDRFVRSEVARNPTCPAEIVLRLARDKDKFVRRATIKRDDALPEALAALAVDPDDDVRAIVARHPDASVTTLLGLAGDRVRWVAGAARDNPNLPRATLAMWQLVHGTVPL